MEVGEDRTDEESLRRWDGAVEGRCKIEEGEKFGRSGCWRDGKTVVEQVENGGIRRGDETDETA